MVKPGEIGPAMCTAQVGLPFIDQYLAQRAGVWKVEVNNSGQHALL